MNSNNKENVNKINDNINKTDDNVNKPNDKDSNINNEKEFEISDISFEEPISVEISGKVEIPTVSNNDILDDYVEDLSDTNQGGEDSNIAGENQGEEISNKNEENKDEEDSDKNEENKDGEDSDKKDENKDGESSDKNEENKDGESSDKNEENKDGEDSDKKDENKDGESSDKNEENKDGESSDKKDENKDGESSDKKDENKDGESSDKKDENKDGENSDKKDEKPNSEDPNKKDENQGNKNSDKNNENQEKNDNDNKNQNPQNKSSENSDGKQDNQKNDKKSDQKPKSSADEKRQEAKNKQENNRNKNNSKNKDNKGSLKDRIKNKANPKNLAKKAANKTKTGQAINDAKDKVEKAKKAVKTIKKIIEFVAKYWQIILAGLAVVVVILMIIFFIAILQPGPGGDVNDSDNTSNYSKADQKTLQKLKKIFEAYPNADGTLAMVTVLYPYFSTLHDGNVLSYLDHDITDEESENLEDDTLEDDIDNEDVEEDETDLEENDMYLQPFRKSKIRKKLKKVLKELNGSTEDQFKEYLKNNYFKKDSGYGGFDDSFEAYNGYKEMFDLIKSDRRDEFADAVIEELYSKKDLFLEYVYTNLVCSTSSTDLGYFDAGNIISGEAYVVLKDTSSGNFSTIKNATTLYQTDNYDLSLRRYVMGVAYAEVGDGVKVEAEAKAVMITAKSFVLARTASGSSNTAGMGFEYDKMDNKTIFYMRGNVNDQDFCDIYEGCESGRFSKSTWTNFTGEGYNSRKSALSVTDISNLEKWYDETAGEFIYDDTNKAFAGNQYNDYNSYCKQGSCLSQTKASNLALSGEDYKSILYGTNGAFSESRFTEYNMNTNTLAKVSGSCVGVRSNGGCEIPEDKFIYYSQRNYSQTFCGRSDNATISSSGCGVTSMAMILANLTDNSTTPLDTNDEAKLGGYCGNGIAGTAASYLSYSAKKHGLTYDSVLSTADNAEEKVKKTLNSGGLVIASVGNGWKGSNGHYLVIKGVTQDGKLIIADPMDKHYNEKPDFTYLTIDEIKPYMADSRSFYLFTSNKSADIVKNYCSVGDGNATGFLGNPVDPSNTTQDFSSMGNASCFPNYCGGSPHGAVDLPYSEGTSVYAMDGGIVSEVGDYSSNCYGSKICNAGNNSYGIYVEIDHGNGYKTLYAHFSQRLVNKGDKVSKGMLIGKSGNTGNSTGPHLHIELQNLPYKSSRDYAKSHKGAGLMNATLYINKNISYVGQTQ